MGGGDSGGGGSPPPANTSQTVTQNLPAYVEPYAKQVMERAGTLSNQPYQQYTGDRIADLTPQNIAGLNMIQNRAMYGSPEEDAGRIGYLNTMSGAYMNPDANPWLAQTANRALGDVSTRVNSQFGGSNYGTTAHQETLARSLGDTSAQIYGQNYQNEREAQQRAMALTPQFSGIDYTNAQQMLGVGDVYRQENQAVLNQNYGDWLEQQSQPYKNLDVLASGVKGGMAGGGTATQTYQSGQAPYQTNKTANALGGAMAGGALGGMVNPSYAPYGAAAGGLLGLWG